MAETTRVHENDVEVAGEITHNWRCFQGLQCNCGRQTRFEIFIHNLKIWQFLVLVTFFVLLLMGTIFIFAILLSSLLPMGSPQDSHAG